MDTAEKLVTDIAALTELSDEEIAQLVGSSQPTIWRIRSGQTKACKSDLYIALMALRDEKLKAAKVLKGKREHAQ